VRYFAVAFVLFEVNRTLETFNGHLFSIGVVDCVVNAGGHPLADLFDWLEGGVES